MKHTIYDLLRVEAPSMFTLASPNGFDPKPARQATKAFFDAVSKGDTSGYPTGTFPMAAADISKHPELFEPVVVKRGRAYKDLLDRLTFHNNRHLYSERCKDAILEFDPQGGHQFVRAELIDAKGEMDFPPYYWVLGGRRIGAMYPPRGVRGIPHVKGWKPSPTPYDHWLLTKERAAFFANLPCWSTTRGLALTYMTHDMISALRARGLTGFEPFDPGFEADMWALDNVPSGTIFGSVDTVTFEI